MGRFEAPNGQVFDRSREEPYTRADGTRTALVVWVSRCAVCGAEFEVKTPAALADPAASKSFGARHCAAHKLTKTEVKARWLAGIDASKRKKNAAKKQPTAPQHATCGAVVGCEKPTHNATTAPQVAFCGSATNPQLPPTTPPKGVVGGVEALWVEVPQVSEGAEC